MIKKIRVGAYSGDTDADTIREGFIKDNENTAGFYGGKIQNFLVKLRSRADMTGIDDIKIVIMGDSITLEDTYIDTLIDYLKTTYGLTDANFTRITYSGYTILQFAKLIEDAVINANADLLYISEDTWGATYHYAYESLIRLIRERSTADIMIGTWTVSNEDLDNAATRTTATYDAKQNPKRDLALKYNCEINEIQKALINAVLDEGETVDSIISGAGNVHPTALGHTYIYNETIRHFMTPDWTERNNIPNPLIGTEELHKFNTAILFPFLPAHFALTGSWDLNTGFIYSSTNGGTIIFDFDGIGFDLYYIKGSTASHTVLLSNDGGSTWVAPSSILVNTLPLEYCTEIAEKVVAEPDYFYTNRFYKAYIDTGCILNNGETSREFEITLTDIQGSGTLTKGDYSLKDITNNAVIGTGSILTDSAFSIGSGRLVIPQNYIYGANYANSGYQANGDTYKFFVKSNWIDTLDTGVGSTGLNKVRVFGLPRDEWKVKITKADGVRSDFDSIKAFKPPLK